MAAGGYPALAVGGGDVEPPHESREAQGEDEGRGDDRQPPAERLGEAGQPEANPKWPFLLEFEPYNVYGWTDAW